LLPEMKDAGDAALRKLPRAEADPITPGPHLTKVRALQTIFALAGGHRGDSSEKTASERYVQQWQQTLGIGPEGTHAFFMRLIAATLDPSPGVRATAFRFLDAFPGEGPELGGLIHFLWGDDPSAQCRFQAALFLGKCSYGDTLPALARIGRRDGTDRWT